MRTPSPFLVWSFSAVAIVTYFTVVALYSRATKRFALTPAILLAVWAAASVAVAAVGKLRFSPPPATMPLLILLSLGVTVSLAFSRFGRAYGDGLSLAAIVGLNAFRLPLELVMHRAATEGVMPPQMSYGGLNFDIVTGVSAVLVAALLTSRAMSDAAKKRLAYGWNITGVLLLLTILTIALLSSPTPLRQFHNDPPNVWITQAPFVLLVTLLVPVALFSHIVLFRKLRR